MLLDNQDNFQNRKGLSFGENKNNKKPNKRSHGLQGKKNFGYINYLYFNYKGHNINDCYYWNNTYVLRPNQKPL